MARMNELAAAPSALRLPAGLGAAARRGFAGQPQAGRAAVAAGGPPGAAPAQPELGQEGAGRRPRTRPGTCRPARPNDVWSYDFMGGAHPTTAGRCGSSTSSTSTRALALGCRVARSIGARDVQSRARRLFARHGQPRVLRSDNGREFIAATPGRVAGRAGRPARLHREGQPAAERLRRALQRHHARRAPQRRRVRQPARGARRDRRAGSNEYNTARPTAASA